VLRHILKIQYSNHPPREMVAEAGRQYSDQTVKKVFTFSFPVPGQLLIGCARPRSSFCTSTGKLRIILKTPANPDTQQMHVRNRFGPRRAIRFRVVHDESLPQRWVVTPYDRRAPQVPQAPIRTAKIKMGPLVMLRYSGNSIRSGCLRSRSCSSAKTFSSQ
jgi:hypothetical protein